VLSWCSNSRLTKLSYSKQQITLPGIIYLHRISDRRFGEKPQKKTLGHFKALCGDRWPEKVVLVTTMWRQVGRELGEKRQLPLEAHFEEMLTLGCKTMPFKATFKSAWDVLDAVTKSDEVNENNSLLLHKEPINLDPITVQAEKSSHDKLQEFKQKLFLIFRVIFAWK
jgi:hypothetical protein